MYNFFVDVRDYIYIHADYRYRGIGYWVFCSGIVGFYYLGFFLLFGIIMPDWLFYYLSKNGTYSSLQQILNIVALGIPCILFVKGFDYISRNAPLPTKEEITPKVFRRKTINMYILLLTGFAFFFICIAIFFKVKFQSG